MLVAFAKEISWTDVLKGSLICYLTALILVLLFHSFASPITVFFWSFFTGGVYVGRKQLNHPKTHGFLVGICTTLLFALISLFGLSFGYNQIRIGGLLLGTSLIVIFTIPIAGLSGLIGSHVGSKFPKQVVTGLEGGSLEDFLKYYEAKAGEIKILQKKDLNMVVKATLPKKRPKYYVIINGMVMHEFDSEPETVFF